MSVEFGHEVSRVMAKQRSRHDSTFGELTQVAADGWERPLQLSIFGREWTVSLLVEIDPRGGVEENQALAFRTFSEHADAITAAAEVAIHQHYQVVCGEYRCRSGVSDPGDERVPLINSVRDVYRLVKPTGVTFPYAQPRPTFGILCECSWEEEHGLAVKFEDGKIPEVGFQDIVL